MRNLFVIAVVATLGLSSCSAISDNVKIDVDVKGIVASTCQQLADGLADQLAEAVVQLDAGTDVELPEVDVRGLIDRAEGLGCSPDDLGALVSEKLDDLDANSDVAREYIDQVSSQLDGITTR